MLLIDERLAHILMRHVEVDANHQTATTDVLNVWTVYFLQLLHQVSPDLVGVIHQSFLFKDIEDGQCCCAGQVVAAKRGAQLSIDGLEVGGYQHACHWETVGDALGHGDDVRTDVKPLVGKEPSATTVATLYLVTYQDSAILLAQLLQPLGKLLGGQLDAAHTLDALQNDGADVAFLQFVLPGCQIVHRQVGHMSVGVDGGYDLGIVGHLDSQ